MTVCLRTFTILAVVTLLAAPLNADEEWYLIHPSCAAGSEASIHAGYGLYESIWYFWSGRQVHATLGCWDPGGCDRVLFIDGRDLTGAEEVFGHEIIGEYPAYHHRVQCL